MAKRTKKAAVPEIRTLAVAALQAAAYNPRTISEAAMAGLSASLARFGCVEPVVVNVRGGKKTIVGGHQRVKALMAAGVKEAACVVVSLSEADEKALNVTLNNPLICGEFSDALGDLIAGLETSLPESDLLDLRIAELKGEIDGEMGTEGLTDPDDVPDPPKKAITKPGDLWLLGGHRLLCGDSTKPADVERLMDGQKADMCFTDPPYNVNYGDKANMLNKYSKGHRNIKSIENDNMKSEAFLLFLIEAFKRCFESLVPGGAFYICHAETTGLEFRQAAVVSGLEVRQCIIWAKNSLVLGRQDYQWRHEPILYGWKPGASHKWQGGRKQTTVLEDPCPVVIEERRGGGGNNLCFFWQPVLSFQRSRIQIRFSRIKRINKHLEN